MIYKVMHVVYVNFMMIFFFGQQYLVNHHIKHISTYLCHNFNGDLSAERKEDLQSRTVSALPSFLL